jgi:hypothetical protein
MNTVVVKANMVVFIASFCTLVIERVIGARAGKTMTAHIVPQERLQQILRDRPSVILTDDYVTVDNLTAPIFEARYGYKKK